LLPKCPYRRFHDGGPQNRALCFLGGNGFVSTSLSLGWVVRRCEDTAPLGTVDSRCDSYISKLYYNIYKGVKAYIISAAVPAEALKDRDLPSPGGSRLSFTSSRTVQAGREWAAFQGRVVGLPIVYYTLCYRWGSRTGGKGSGIHE